MVDGGPKWGKVVRFMFMGSYNYTIDEKGRITIPTKLRSDLGTEFILTRGLDGCLALYPRKAWDSIISKYKELPNIQNARNFLRFILSSASACSLDKQGRLSISSSLLQFAEIKKECVIIGVDECLEIWSKEKWEGYLENNEANLAQMADELFSGSTLKD